MLKILFIFYSKLFKKCYDYNFTLNLVKKNAVALL